MWTRKPRHGPAFGGRMRAGGAIAVLAIGLTAGFGNWAHADTQMGALWRKIWDHSLQAAEAQDKHETSDDVDSPIHNAVVRVGGCSGVLITPSVVLTAGHCVPRELGRQTPHPDCLLLAGQARLAGFPWHAPYEWRDFPRGGIQVRIAARRDQAKMAIGTVAVSQPRCADMAALRLARKVPDGVATPMPVMTRAPLNIDRTFGAAQLRYAGWGLPKGLIPVIPARQTGRVRYWGANDCFLAALPPLRRNGQRIISGDSGAPLLLRQGETEVVAGILWGKGAADRATCGRLRPPPPFHHGLYTTTFRRPILGTGATDIGDWLNQMVPEADLR